MNIRRAEKIDVAKILDLLVQVGNVHADLRPDLFLPGKTKYTEEELLEIIADDSRPIFVCINENSELCGYAFCLIQEITGYNLISHKSIYIDDICVDEAHRHEHVATSLYEHVLNFAKELGCFNVTLNVWEGNTAARSLYEHCGMKIQKTVMEKIL